MSKAGVALARRLRAVAFLVMILVVCLFIVVFDIIIYPYVAYTDDTRFTYHRINAWMARVCLKPFITVRIEGASNLKVGEATVLCANHQSALDAFILAVLGHVNFKCTFKRSILFYPGIGQAFAFAKHISVVRGDRESGANLMRDVDMWLRRGVSVLFFPEGTRKVEGVMGPFKRGAFKASVDAQVPITPITIRGARDIMSPRGYPELGWGTVTLVIHPQIDPAGKEYTQLMDETRDVILSALKEG